MPRVKRSTKRSDRRKKILKRASGYFLTKSKLYLWIVRINAACKINGMSYSTFIAGLKAAGNQLDRKILADIAANDAPGFAALVAEAKAGLAGKSTQAAA